MKLKLGRGLDIWLLWVNLQDSEYIATLNADLRNTASTQTLKYKLDTYQQESISQAKPVQPSSPSQF